MGEVEQLETPKWFTDAVDHPYEEVHFPLGDVSLRALRWRDPEHQGIPTLALHGGMAHADWWRFVAPLLLPKHDVVAIDLSGHGLSGRRSEYGFELWVEEIVGAAQHFFGDQKVVLLGHSMGGLLSVKTAAKYPDLWRGLVISDAPLHEPFGRKDPNDETPIYIKRDYPDFETAVQRFRLLPAQPITHPFIVRFLAESSLKQNETGQWTWKFDPSLFSAVGSVPFAEPLSRLKAPMWFLWAELSKIVPAETREVLAEHCRNPWQWIHIDQAHHHMMLDQPHSFAEHILALPL